MIQGEYYTYSGHDGEVVVKYLGPSYCYVRLMKMHSFDVGGDIRHIYDDYVKREQHRFTLHSPHRA